MSQEFSQDSCKIILQFFGKVPINAKFYRLSRKLVYFSHFWTLFKCLSKTVLKFSKFFFKISLNFCAISPQFPYRLFKTIFTINSNLSCNFSKAHTQKYEILEKFFNNFYKIISKCLEKFLKISGIQFPNFLRKHQKMQDFLEFLHYLFTAHISKHFFSIFLESFSKLFQFFFQNFTRFLCSFSKVHLTYPHNFSVNVHVFYAISQK